MDEKEESTKAELLDELAALRRQVKTLEAWSVRTERVEDEYALFFLLSRSTYCALPVSTDTSSG